MSDLPAPLVSADVDLTGLDGFMLDVQRLFASELWALSTGDEFKAALGLWGRAWQQKPPGSLPDDERALAAFSGAGRNWRKVRGMALRGFVKCSDGRLYHKVLCEDVATAHAKRVAFKERTRGATEARRLRNVSRRDDRNDIRNDNRDASTEGNVTSDVTSVQGQGRRQGHKELSPAVQPEPAARGHAEFDRIENLCREALGSAAPADPVIGPMIALIRKGIPEQAIVDALRSEARRQRQKPIRTWGVWATIVAEKIAEQPQFAKPNGHAVDEPAVDFLNGCAPLAESKIIRAIEQPNADWERAVFGSREAFRRAVQARAPHLMARWPNEGDTKVQPRGVAP